MSKKIYSSIRQANEFEHKKKYKKFIDIWFQSPHFNSHLRILNCGVAAKVIVCLISFGLCWVFVAAHEISLVMVSRAILQLQCTGFSLWWLLFLQEHAPQRVGSVVVAEGLSCSLACGIFPEQGSTPNPLHWQVDS